MPTETRVAIIGGGIWGCSIAYHLAKAGCRDVTILERREVASGVTPMAAGLVGQLRTSELMARAIRQVVRTLERFEEETGEDPGFKQVGSLKLALNDARVAELRRQVEVARGFGIEVELIAPQEARARVPVLETEGLKAVAWIPKDGYVDPYTLATSLARAAKRLGATIRTQSPVTGLLVRRGRVRGVRLDGEEVHAERVVVAAGPWAELIAEWIGLRLPMVPIRHQLWITAPIEGLGRDFPVVRVPDASVYIRPELGGMLVGGFEAHPRTFSMKEFPANFQMERLEQDWEVLTELGAKLADHFPVLGTTQIARACAGLPTFTPDGEYLLGEVRGVKGLYLASGCNALGIAGSLIIGQWIAELILEGKASADLSSQSLTRFAGRYRGRGRLARDSESTYSGFYSLERGRL